MTRKKSNQVLQELHAATYLESQDPKYTVNSFQFSKM